MPQFVSLVLLLIVGAVACIGDAASQVKPAPPQEIRSRGEYLARAGDCISCHSSSEGGQYGAGCVLAHRSDFFCPRTSRSIQQLGSADGAKTISGTPCTTGTATAMPYTFFAKATREDVDAIYDYLCVFRSKLSVDGAAAGLFGGCESPEFSFQPAVDDVWLE